MPFSSQPRKKGIPASPRGGQEKPPCGQPVSNKKVADLPTEKVLITRLREKIADKATADKRFSEKAATVLSSWLNSKKK